MFSIRSEPGAATVNALTPIAIQSQEERTARHLSACQELAELGMQLARIAAQKALRDWQAEEATRPGETPPATTRSADPSLTFTRLSLAVRQAITLEAQIAAGPEAFLRPTARSAPRAAAPPDQGAQPHPDPRHALLTRVFDEAIKLHPRRAEIRRTIAGRIDHDLALDPHGEYPAGVILPAISEDLGIEIDYTKMSDETLEALVPKSYTPTAEQEADWEAGNYSPFSQKKPAPA